MTEALPRAATDPLMEDVNRAIAEPGAITLTLLVPVVATALAREHSEKPRRSELRGGTSQLPLATNLSPVLTRKSHGYQAGGSEPGPAMIGRASVWMWLGTPSRLRGR